VLSALNKIRPNFVLCGGYNYLASWELAFWTKLHGVPLLLWSESTASDQRRRHRLVEFMKERFLGMCGAFVVPGKASLQYLKDLGIAENRIFSAPNAVDIRFFATSAEAARRDEFKVCARLSLPSRYFLYVGRLVRAKGVFELVEAYSQLDDEIRAKVGLVFVGDGPERSELMERTSRTAPGTVQYHGFVHREGLPEFYALADALIFPTHSDTWGLVVNEAMSCGLPVIVTSVAGCGLDLVQDGWNGFVVPPGDSSQLAAAMARLAGSPEMRMEMGLRGRERIEAYSPAAWADGLVRAMELAGERQR
jgi:glycosyltransferase involved in cell wall biosynthesis